MRQEENQSDETGLVFKDFLKAPIFPVTPHMHEVYCDGWTWRTGVVTPLDVKRGKTVPDLPGLTIEHAEILLGLMTFQPVDYHLVTNPPAHWRFSLADLTRVVYGNSGGSYYDKAAALLGDLAACWGSVHFHDSGETHYFRVLEKISIVTKKSRRNLEQQELWLDNVVIHESYQKLLSIITRQMFVDIHMFKHVTSPVAKSIYFFLPSRAVHHDVTDPFRISLKLILDQIGYKGRVSYKADRKQIFMQGKNPVINQLNGAAILGGKKLRVSLEETAEDWILLAWVDKAEKQIDIPPRNKTEEFFRMEMKWSLTKWAQLVDSLDMDLSKFSHVEKWVDGMNTATTWQFAVYATALGHNNFQDILAQESDGRAQIGAMINKFRRALKALKKT
jgi:hypothetical protein